MTDLKPTLSAQAQQLMQAFLDYQKTRTSQQGHYRLHSLIRQVLTWFDEQDLDLCQVGIQQAVAYQAWLAGCRLEDGRAYQTGTILNYLKTARRFWAWLCSTRQARNNPFLDLHHPRLGEHLSRNVLTESQMGQLLHRLADFHTLASLPQRRRRYRVHVLAEFLYATGLRIAEAAAVQVGHLELDQHRLQVPCGKGGRPRTAFLTSRAVAVLSGYLGSGRAVILGRYGRSTQAASLFGACPGRLMELLNQELHQVCTEAGLPVITSHGFRHSLGTHLLKSGCDLRHIQAILGHEVLQTTQIYTRVDKEDLKKSLDAHHPRQWQHAGAGS